MNLKTQMVNEICKSLREEPERWKENNQYQGTMMSRDDELTLWIKYHEIYRPYRMNVGFWNRLKLSAAIRDCKAINLIRLAQKRLKP